MISRAEIADRIERYISEWCAENGRESVWERPVVKFADAANPRFAQLKEIVVFGHHIPQDYLPSAKSVVCYFLPFKRAVADSNKEGELASQVWMEACLTSNLMAASLNEHLTDFFRQHGYEAAVPTDAGMISHENPKSRWSQRHVAYIAGHGTFGLNNMLISDKGCAGRYFSVVTTMPAAADAIPETERCLYKRAGKCTVCVQRCPVGALHTDGYERFRCFEQCQKNEARFVPGADFCGKCVVGLPCSFGAWD